MMAHLIHSVIIHTAAWIPLILWSLETLRNKSSARWFVIGSLAVAMSFLGGHGQIFVYGLTVGVGYAITIGWSAPVGRWRYYLTVMLMIILGVGLAAIQIVPTAELFGQSVRLGYSFVAFVSHSLPPRQSLTMIFPQVFGGMREAGQLPYFGAQNQIELTGYVGLLPVILAAIGIIASSRKSLSRFWLGAAVLAFLLAMGDATPLARLIYHVPVLGSFRAPGRHLMESTLALSVLSGLGVAAISRREISAILMRGVVLFGSLAMLICLVLLFLNASYMSGLAAQKEITQLNLSPWANRAVGIPVIIFLLGVIVLVYWHRLPTWWSRKALLLSVLIIDLGSFGWFYQWRYYALDKNELIAPEIAVRYKNLLADSEQRLLSQRGIFGAPEEIPPNLSMLWQIPSAGGFDSLIPSRISRLLSMSDVGAVSANLPWKDPNDAAFNLMAIRYLVLPPNKAATDPSGISWAEDDMQLWLGSGCNEPARKSATARLTAPVKSSAIAVVSGLACSTQFPDGTEVARVRLTETDGKVQTLGLVAGRDSSEWAYDCRSVRPQMRHQRADIFRSYPAKMYEETCAGHSYVTRLSFGEPKNVKSIEVEWVQGPGAIILEKLSLIDEQSHTSRPIDSVVFNDGWRLAEETETSRVYENMGAMPRAWLAPEAVSIDPEAAISTIKTASLPDGRHFDPRRTALVEGPVTLTETDSRASATVTALSDDRMEVRTISTAPGFLVTSDAYYPGWRASIDGKDSALYRTDYAIRGVLVPAGEHLVRFEYRPRSFYIGAAVSILSLLVAGIIAFRRPFPGD